jgi:hypothetical protein
MEYSSEDDDEMLDSDEERSIESILKRRVKQVGSNTIIPDIFSV